MHTPSVRPWSRERRPTALDDWMRAGGVSNIALSQMVGCGVNIVQYWRQGQCLPNLLYAFKIERATKGAIPAVYWIDTDLGREQWGECAL